MSRLRRLALDHPGVQPQRVLLALSIAAGVILWAWIVRDPHAGWDAHVYWSASLADPYASSAAGAPGAYLYSPAFRQALEPLALLSWPLFHALWEALLIGLVVALAGPFAVFVLLNPIAIFELQAGNIHVLLAAAIVFGFRYPAAWTFVLLTKVTPGIGILWFLVRREWRNLAAVAVATGLVVAASLVLAPDLWAQWIRSLAANAAIPASDYSGGFGGPLWVRGPLAAVLVTWGALTDRRWTVPVAATLAIPLLGYINLAVLVAAVPLVLPDAGLLVRRWLPPTSAAAAASATGAAVPRGSRTR
jgi:hypothetical protein